MSSVIGTIKRQPLNEATSEKAVSSETPAATISYWKSGGSIMRLEATGVSRKFSFFEPSEVQLKSGAQVGSVRFDGKISGKGYKGTAFLYSEQCGRVGFPVSGQIDNDGGRVTLTGKSPRLSSRCRKIGTKEQTLVFNFVEPNAQ
jgi:hypothetical protein